MSSFATVRSRVSTILNTVAFDDNKELRASAYLTEQINVPQAFFDFEIPEQLTFGATSKHPFVLTVQVLDNRDDARSSQARLDQLRDPSDSGGLKQVLELASNWSSEVDYCRFLSCTAVEVAQVGGIEYLSIEFRFEVCF
jgi:hypothetical protein